MTNKPKNETTKKTEEKDEKKTIKKQPKDTIGSLKSTIQSLTVEKQGFGQRIRKAGLKTALIAVTLLVISTSCLYLVAYSNQMTDSGVTFGMMVGVIVGGVIVGVIVGIIVGVIVGGIAGGIFDGISGGILGGIVGGIVSGMFGGILGGILSGIIGGMFGIVGGMFGGMFSGMFGNTLGNKKVSVWTIALLGIVFLLPFIITVTPLSKYHNQNQIKRDKKIVDVLEITILENGVEVLLPDKYASENDYLKKVFSVAWMDEQLKAWKEIVIPCQEGDKYWYKVKLPFPLWYRLKLVGNPSSIITEEEKKKYESNADNIVLFFDHVWEDHKITIEISFQDPNSL